MEINKVLDILDIGSKILNIEQIIIATKHNKNYEIIHKILKECKNDLSEQIIKIYNGKSYKYGVLERDQDSIDDKITNSIKNAIKAFEEHCKTDTTSTVKKPPIRKTTKK